MLIDVGYYTKKSTLTELDGLMDAWEKTLREYNTAKLVLENVETDYQDAALTHLEGVELRLMQIHREIKKAYGLKSTVIKPNFSRKLSQWFQNSIFKGGCREWKDT